MHIVQNYKVNKTKQVPDILVWQTGSYSSATDKFEVKKLASKSV